MRLDHEALRSGGEVQEVKDFEYLAAKEAQVPHIHGYISVLRITMAGVWKMSVLMEGSKEGWRRAGFQGTLCAYLQQEAWRNEGGSTLGGTDSLLEGCIYKGDDSVHLIPRRRTNLR